MESHHIQMVQILEKFEKTELLINLKMKKIQTKITQF